MTTNQKLLRANLLSMMEAYVMEIGEENIIDLWRTYGLSDEYNTDDVAEIVNSTAEFKGIVEAFTSIVANELEYENIGWL